MHPQLRTLLQQWLAGGKNLFEILVGESLKVTGEVPVGGDPGAATRKLPLPHMECHREQDKHTLQTNDSLSVHQNIK